MAEDYLVVSKCILCRVKYNTNEEFRNIKSTSVSKSKKSIKDVLTHISKCITTQVILEDGAFVCSQCYDRLVEYDQIMLQLLVHQRKLARMLETSMNTIDFDDEVDFIDDIKEEENKDDELMQSESDDDDNNTCDSDHDSSKEETLVTSKIGRSESYCECKLCSKLLCSKASLRAHLVRHSKAKRCHICGVLCRNEEYLELHMNNHEGKSENECRYCPKRYSRRSNVIRHMQLHWDKKKFQCEKCGLRFSQANLLYNHKMHHDAEETPLVCTLCDQTFKSKKTYSHHMVTHREDRPMYPCDICGKKFTEKYTLKVHLKTHKDASELSCIVCDKVFSGKRMLEEHMTADHDVINSVLEEFI